MTIGATITMAKVAFQLLSFADDLGDDSRAPRMRRAAERCAEWLHRKVPETENGWFPRRMTLEGETYRKSPDGGNDPFWQTSADGLFILQLWSALTRRGIADYSMQKRVIPVSPNTFYLYLQTIMLGLKGLEIEKNAQEIISALGRLKVDFDRFNRDFRLIRTHLRNASVCCDSADRKRQRFEDRLAEIASAQSEKKDQDV